VRTEKKKNFKNRNKKKGRSLVKGREVRSKEAINGKQKNRKSDVDVKSMTGGRMDRKNRGGRADSVLEGARHVRRRLLFWNVAGTLNKDIEFWDYLKMYDYVGLCETWMTENMWENWKDKLPASHVWSCSFAIRRKEKGRAIGGLIIGIKKDWADKEWEVIKREEGNIGMLRIKDKNRITVIVLVYNREKMERS